MRFLKKPEIQIPLSFVSIALTWILISDKLLLYFCDNLASSHLTNIQTAKGCGFVAAVAVFIHKSIKSANNKWAESQQEYKDLFCNTPNPMLLYNPTTKKIINVNEAALFTYGYTSDEFLQMSIDDLEVESATNYQGVNNIHKHRKKNNEIISCQGTTRKIKFNRVQACLLSAHDITELENAKAELVSRENELNLILNSITDGFFIINQDLKIERANEVFKTMTEVQVEKVEGVKLFNLFPSLKQKFLLNKYSLELQKNKSLYFETYYKQIETWYSVSAYPYQGARFFVFFRDITKEKENELRIQNNEQNLLALINNTDDLIWTIDRSFRYFTFNEPFKKWYNQYFGEDVWIGKVAFDQTEQSTFDINWKNWYRRALAGDKFAVNMHFEINNEFYFSTVRFNPIYNENNQIFAVGCFMQNKTESKLREKKIEQQNLQLKEIAFITSHKVRVPLANILGLTEVLDNENPLSSSNRKIIEYIKTSAKELDASITNMVLQTVQINDKAESYV